MVKRMKLVERMISVIISVNSTVFDILALLCSFLTLTEERECAIAWETASENDIRACIIEYSRFIEIILKNSVNNYKFNDSDLEYITDILDKLYLKKAEKKDCVYLLAREVENKLERYSGWKNEDVIYKVDPLNSNYKLTGVRVYPHTKPRWDMKKSERCRRRNFNTVFTNYMIIRQKEIEPFEVDMYYWNDGGMLKHIKDGWAMSIAIAPVTDNAVFQLQEKNTAQGKTIRVDGIENEEATNDKVLGIFDTVFCNNYSIIVFPEMLGSDYILAEVKKRMRKHPECVAIVLLPTICKDGKNTLVVLGPGGVECLRQNKVAPFILIDDEGTKIREELDYDNKIHLLNTQELGIMAFPICADLLDSDYYHVITDVAMADTIICPSCSPGINAFIDTMNKGIPLKILEVYLNTCSAKVVSRNGSVSDILGIVQLPGECQEGKISEVRRECNGVCSEEGCYFDINIYYQDHVFTVEKVHNHGRCA